MHTSILKLLLFLGDVSQTLENHPAASCGGKMCRFHINEAEIYKLQNYEQTQVCILQQWDIVCILPKGYFSTTTE